MDAAMQAGGLARVRRSCQSILTCNRCNVLDPPSDYIRRRHAPPRSDMLFAVKERIQKILANAGVDSRRNVEEMVRQGRISVNGRTVWNLPILVDPATDKIQVDGEPIHLKAPASQRRHYFILNKPQGVYSTNVAQGAQVRAIDLLPKNFRARLYPVGRLD